MEGHSEAVSNGDTCKRSHEANQTQSENGSAEYISPEIRNKLEEVLVSKGITGFTMVIEPGSSIGDNFMGFIGKITITGLDQNKEETTLNWILKTAPTNDLYRKALKVDLLYAREIYMYETILPEMEKFQKDKSALEPFKNYPRFVFSYMEPYQESFAMENIKLEGYVMGNRHETLNYDHVKLLMKTYAKFHAVSLAIKDQKPEEFAVLAENMKDVMTAAQENEEIYASYKMMVDSAFDTLDQTTDQRVITNFKKFSDNFFDISNDSVNMTNRYSVMGHGDSWVNNILWKYEDPCNKTTPATACLLDFQLARYASPACDLSYFLFTCTDKSLRDEHYDNAIKLYYYTLCAHLVELGSDPEKVFPFAALQEELKRFSIVGMFWTLVVLFNIMRDSDELPDMKNTTLTEEEITEQFSKKFKNHDKYAKRVRDVICDCCEKGYLDFLL